MNNRTAGKLLYPMKGSFFHFLIPYVVILSVPVLLAYAIYYFSSRIVEGEVHRSTASTLEQAREVIDSRLRELDDMAIQLSWNPGIHRFMYTQQPLTIDDRYMSFTIKNDLAKHKISNTFIRDFYIYFKNSNTIINKTGRYEPGFFYENVYTYTELDFGQWYEEDLNSYHNKELMPLRTLVYDNKTMETVTYIQSLPFTERFGWQGTLAVLLDSDQLFRLLKNTGDVSRGASYIINAKDQIVISMGKTDLIQPVKYQELHEESRLQKREINHQTVMVNFVQSTESDWKIVSILPMSVYMEKVNLLRNITVRISLGLLLIGLLAAFLFAYRSYIPVREMIEDNNSLRTQLPILKAGFLTKLIKGDIGSQEECMDYMKLLDIRFDFPAFGVMILRLDAERGGSTSAFGTTLRFVGETAEDTVFKISFPDISVYALSLEDNEMGVLCNFPDKGEEDNNKAMLRAADQLSKQLRQDCGIMVTTAVSGFCSGIQGIPVCYRQAVQTMNYSLVKGKNIIICYSEVQEAYRHQDYRYSLDEETWLINMVKSGDEEGAMKQLEEVYYRNFSGRQLSPAIVRCLMFDMMSTALKCLQEVEPVLEDAAGNGYDPVGRLVKCETIDELYRSLQDILAGTCRYVNRNKKSHNLRLIDDILQYINENYHDRELCLNALATRFNHSAAYLSRFFKEQTGENFLDYLNRIRLEKALSLMNGKKELRIGQVAEEVGCANTGSLIRLFKKYKGVTPTQYRDQTRKA